MTNQNNLKEIGDAQKIVEQLLPLVAEAEKRFKSARNWSFVDIFGGGLIVDFIKYSKLGSAGDTMNKIQYLLECLQRELSEIHIPTDYTMNLGSLVTLADFVFDGILVDVYMQSKIMSSLKQVQELHERLKIVHTKLLELATQQ